MSLKLIVQVSIEFWDSTHLLHLINCAMSSFRTQLNHRSLRWKSQVENCHELRKNPWGLPRTDRWYYHHSMIVRREVSHHKFCSLTESNGQDHKMRCKVAKGGGNILLLQAVDSSCAKRRMSVSSLIPSSVCWAVENPVYLLCLCHLRVSISSVSRVFK